MASNGSPQHPQSRWSPKDFRFTLQLSRRSLTGRTTFSTLIRMNMGYDIPSGSCFSITKQAENRVYIKILVNCQDSSSDELTFVTVSSLEKVSIVCSKLNMSSSLRCKITAFQQDNSVVFSVKALNESMEKKLNQFFSVYGDKS